MKHLPELDRYRDFNRVLLLFAPERTHPSYIQATRMLSDQLERVEEKEIKILSVFGSGRVYDNHDRIESANDVSMRRRFHVPRDEFAAVLLDSDGEQILRQDDHLDVQGVLGALTDKIAPPDRPGPR